MHITHTRAHTYTYGILRNYPEPGYELNALHRLSFDFYRNLTMIYLYNYHYLLFEWRNCGTKGWMTFPGSHNWPRVYIQSLSYIVPKSQKIWTFKFWIVIAKMTYKSLYQSVYTASNSTCACVWPVS